jgi:hypothetical protein
MNQDEYEIIIEKDQNYTSRRIITCTENENIEVFESKILTPKQRATLTKVIGPARIYIKTLKTHERIIIKVPKGTLRGGHLGELLSQGIPSFKRKIRYILNKEDQEITKRQIKEALEEYGNRLPSE